MKTPYELRTEADLLEKTLAKEKIQNELKLANEELLGKAFYCIIHQREWSGINAILYTKFEIDTWGELKYLADEANIIIRGKGRGLCGVLGGERLKYSRSFSDVFRLKFDMPKPMSIDIFKRLWDRAKLQSLAAKAELESLFNSEIPIPYGRDEEHRVDEQLDLDIPFIQLTPPETLIMPNTYTLPGMRYILTPASIKAGKEALSYTSNQLSRGSYLFQECDMQYVNSQNRTFAELNKKIQGK